MPPPLIMTIILLDRSSVNLKIMPNTRLDQIQRFIERETGQAISDARFEISNTDNEVTVIDPDQALQAVAKYVCCRSPEESRDATAELSALFEGSSHQSKDDDSNLAPVRLVLQDYPPREPTSPIRTCRSRSFATTAATAIGLHVSSNSMLSNRLLQQPQVPALLLPADSVARRSHGGSRRCCSQTSIFRGTYRVFLSSRKPSCKLMHPCSKAISQGWSKSCEARTMGQPPWRRSVLLS